MEAIPTGALALDLALGIGGLPRGRIVEIFGPESSGKSTLAMHVVAEAQRNGGVCAYIDAEHAMDPVYANAIGVNVDELLISQPDTGEQALEIADMLIRSGALDVLVIDSVAALVPRAEIEGEMGDSHMGLQARLMSQALRKLTGNLNKSRTIAVFINQLREKIGIVFGNPETTPGGRALKFYASVRLDIRRVESIKDGAEVVGNRARVKVVKNKTAPPFRQAEFDIMYGKGISREGSLLDVGVDLGIVKKSGAWFTYEGEQLGQGRENVKSFLAENVDLMVEISEKIKVASGINDVERSCSMKSKGPKTPTPSCRRSTSGHHRPTAPSCNPPPGMTGPLRARSLTNLRENPSRGADDSCRFRRAVALGAGVDRHRRARRARAGAVRGVGRQRLSRVDQRADAAPVPAGIRRRRERVVLSADDTGDRCDRDRRVPRMGGRAHDRECGLGGADCSGAAGRQRELAVLEPDPGEARDRAARSGRRCLAGAGAHARVGGRVPRDRRRTSSTGSHSCGSGTTAGVAWASTPGCR